MMEMVSQNWALGKGILDNEKAGPSPSYLGGTRKVVLFITTFLRHLFERKQWTLFHILFLGLVHSLVKELYAWLSSFL